MPRRRTTGSRSDSSSGDMVAEPTRKATSPFHNRPEGQEELIGQTIISTSDVRYRIMGKIGEGSQGDVYLSKKLSAQEIASGNVDFSSGENLFAVKILPSVPVVQEFKTQVERDEHQALVTQNAQMANRFMLEALTLATLNNAHIVPLVDYGTGDPKFIVTPYLPGQGFDKLLKNLAADNALLPFPKALSYFEQIANAVADFHDANIVHRDLKPGNLRVSPEGVVHVIDFGIAKNLQRAIVLTGEQQVFGTIAYMPPEQFMGMGKSHNTAVDIFAFGVIMFETLTGKEPFTEFTGDNVTQVATERLTTPAQHINLYRKDLPSEFVIMLMKCLETDSRNRPTAKEVHSLLQKLIANPELIDPNFDATRRDLENPVILEQPAPAPVVEPPKVHKKFPGVLLATALTAVSLIAIAIGINYKTTQKQSPVSAVQDQKPVEVETNAIVFSLPEGAEITASGLDTFVSQGNDLTINYPKNGGPVIGFRISFPGREIPLEQITPNKNARYVITEAQLLGTKENEETTEGEVDSSGVSSARSFDHPSSKSTSSRVHTSNVKILVSLPITAEVVAPGMSKAAFCFDPNTPVTIDYPRGKDPVEFTFSYDDKSIIRKITPSSNQAIKITDADFEVPPLNPVDDGMRLKPWPFKTK